MISSDANCCFTMIQVSCSTILGNITLEQDSRGEQSEVGLHHARQLAGKCYCESFNGKLRNELLNGEIFYTQREAKGLIENGDSTTPHSTLQRPRLPTAGAGDDRGWFDDEIDDRRLGKRLKQISQLDQQKRAGQPYSYSQGRSGRDVLILPPTQILRVRIAAFSADSCSNGPSRLLS
jgi:hypothetical protein